MWQVIISTLSADVHLCFPPKLKVAELVKAVDGFRLGWAKDGNGHVLPHVLKVFRSDGDRYLDLKISFPSSTT